MTTISIEHRSQARSRRGRGAAGGLSGAKLAAFSSIALPIYAAQMPLSVYLPSIYAQRFAIPLTLLGLIFLVEKLWGAAADPIIGALSDCTRSRFGRRRPWIAAGASLFGAAGLFLFFPPGAVTPVYLGASLFLFYLGWSMIQIPYFAWSGEVSGDYHQRTRIVAYQTVVGSAALLAVLVLPTIVDQLRPGDAALKLNAMGAVILLSLAPAVKLTLRAFPEPAIDLRGGARLSFAAALKLIAGEGLLMRVLASDFAVTFGQSTRAGLFVFFVSDFMGLPKWSSGLFLLQYVFGVAAGPIWMKIGYRLGKTRTAVAGELVQAAINVGSPGTELEFAL